MAGITLNKGTKIYTYGQPMTALHLITAGRVEETYPGGSLILSKGDVIGACEMCSEIHYLDYTVVEDTTFLSYPITNVEALDDLMQRHPDMARLFLLSAFRQITQLQSRCSLYQLSCSDLYRGLMDDYEKYDRLCGRYRLQKRPLENIDSFTSYLGDEAPDFWLNEFYAGLKRLYTGQDYKNLLKEPTVSSGLLRKCSLDFRKTYLSLEEQHRYLQKLGRFYFDETGNDLFDRYTALAYKLGADCEEITQIFSDIDRMIDTFQNDTKCDPSVLQKRINTYRDTAARLHVSSHQETSDVSDGPVPSELAGSLNTILDFTGVDLDISNSFRGHVQAYKSMPDKSSMDEDCNALRKALTEEFYVLYSLAFERTLSEPSIPMAVRMFLYFGYVDEELAGHDNAACLYSLTKLVADHSDSGVYTFYDWLLAIFRGDKAPSRNEFDQDYSDYIHKQKKGGNISDAELRALEENAMGKVNFELRNVFPSVNKMTFGRVTTFCPLFTADNVLKNLKDTFVTVSKLSHALEAIKKVDYTAFYRESLDMEHLDIIGKETIHLEYLPDFILTPNVGIRGVMWQEIEGKVRNSPSRMFLSIFHLEDINTTLIRMTGEFRWELCKRVQGSRWNDVSDRSLTSEYYDYIQFYRKNHDLSAEAKEKVRIGLQRAKNSFKEMFVRDYLIWVLFEGTGSPRLNKVARTILFTYCPFPSDVCQVLQQNPLYTEILDRHRLHTAQKLHHLDVLIKKLQNSGTLVPDTLERERVYLTGIGSNDN